MPYIHSMSHKFGYATFAPTQSMATSVTLIPEVNDDRRLLKLWLHGRAKNTSTAYSADIGRFLFFIGRPLRSVTLGDLQAFSDSLGGMAPESQSRVLSSMKSLLSFAH